MKKTTVLFLAIIASTAMSFAQGKGSKVGYIDMEYILQKLPAYAEANSQLEQKAQIWKNEVEEKKNGIIKLKEALKTEKVLLTKELIEEREEEIAYQEKDLMDYQEKRFGPAGDLMTQKAVLVKPIQDQVFNAVQDLAEARSYDYILDKSSNLTVLFASKRFDLSDKVINAIMRGEKTQKLNKKEQKALEDQEKRELLLEDRPEILEREAKVKATKEERQKMIEERKAAAEAKRLEAQAKREEALAQRQAEREAKLNKKNNGTVSDKNNKEEGTKPSGTENKNTTTEENKEVENKRQAVLDAKGEENKALKDDREAKKKEADENRKKTQEERQKAIDQKKKDAEEKRAKLAAEKEALRLKKEEERKNKQK